jgi:preprotein translocase subunit SecY
MFQVFRNAWKIEELRKKILFTLFIILLYRIGNAVPVPYINTDLLQEYFGSIQNTVLGLVNAMSGSAFSHGTIFALSIQPYINASIIMQLLCIAIPARGRLQKEGGEEGRKKIASITRYATVVIGLLQGFGFYMLLRNNSAGGMALLSQTGVWPAIVIILTFVAGASLLMWMGEQITEFGIGNGISVILFASIISRLPNAVVTLITNLSTGTLSWIGFLAIVVGVLLIVVCIVFVSKAERRIPIQYSKRVVGRKLYGGQSTHLPVKVNMSGVMPVIFAQSIASLPATIAAFFKAPAEGSFWDGFLKAIDTTSVLYMVIYFLLIIAFSYFYATIQFNPIEIANNLKKNGGFIPGFRAGRPTSEFISKVLSRITLFGAIYLGVVCVLPILFSKFTNMTSIYLGGTSIIIAVGVALEIVQSLETQMMMRHYKGFLE